MTILDILRNIWNLLQSSWRPALEITILAVGIYYVLMFVRGTRGWPIVVGFLMVLLVLTVVTTALELRVLLWLLTKFLTGLAIAVPDGWVGLVHPRSGLARRHGLTVTNAPGTIDAGYRGEVTVLLVNLGQESVTIRRGDRVAQLLLQRVGRAEVVEVEALDRTTRGAGGFGSTGVQGVAVTVTSREG